jgi:hypothetical protein
LLPSRTAIGVFLGQIDKVLLAEAAVIDVDDHRAMTFAAYNAGRGSVKKWIDRYGDRAIPGSTRSTGSN